MHGLTTGFAEGADMVLGIIDEHMLRPRQKIFLRRNHKIAKFHAKAPLQPGKLTGEGRRLQTGAGGDHHLTGRTRQSHEIVGPG